MRVFITGATGFLGRRVAGALVARGDAVLALTRARARATAAGLDELAGPGALTVLEGDPAAPGPWQEALAGCDAVLALAGERVFGPRLTPAYKARVERSRVGAVQLVAEGLARLDPPRRPGALLTASAYTYYPDGGDAFQPEGAAPGPAFLARLSVAWEAAAGPAAAAGVRTAALRFALVLAPDDGALPALTPLFRRGLGGPLGSGHQYLPWIHEADAVGLTLFCLDTAAIRGPRNATAPQPVTARAFAQTLGAALGRPARLRVPAFLVRVALGDAAEALLGSRRLLPEQALRLGYRFRFPELREAFQDLLARMP